MHLTNQTKAPKDIPFNFQSKKAWKHHDIDQANSPQTKPVSVTVVIVSNYWD